MNVIVLKSPSTGRPVIRIEDHYYYTACLSRKWYTPNARCVHAICRTNTGQAVDNRRFSCPPFVRHHTVLINYKSIMTNDIDMSDTASLKASDMSDSRKDNKSQGYI